MRPRHYTAENALTAAWQQRKRAGFNEAAALHRGKRPSAVPDGVEDVASMRPRHYTAENEQMHGGDFVKPRASMRPRHYTAENDAVLPSLIATTQSLQ